jgi:hypothetical protein
MDSETIYRKENKAMDNTICIQAIQSILSSRNINKNSDPKKL